MNMNKTTVVYLFSALCLVLPVSLLMTNASAIPDSPGKPMLVATNQGDRALRCANTAHSMSVQQSKSKTAATQVGACRADPQQPNKIAEQKAILSDRPSRFAIKNARTTLNRCSARYTA